MLALFLVLTWLSSGNPVTHSFENSSRNRVTTNSLQLQLNSWQYFLQHLPEEKGPIRDYTGKAITNQSKHYSIIKYDVGNRDLQQCADALMRIRAEYLFEQQRYNEIGFHFVNGSFYRYKDYLHGKRPKLNGNKTEFINVAATENNHQSLRNYLDIVYNYASTISLTAELKPAAGFGIGTVIITPGSPGHCTLIVDEKTNERGEKLYKLVEGYMPAQTIYVLKAPDGTPWHRLSGNYIETASFSFTSFELKKFE
jgi:hypothetical protein